MMVPWQTPELFADPRQTTVADLLDQLTAALARAERAEQQLATVTQATNCCRCGAYKHTPLRLADGYVCAGCIEKELAAVTAERDAIAGQVGELHSALEGVSYCLQIRRSYDGEPETIGQRIHQQDCDKQMEAARKALASTGRTGQ